MNKAQQEVESEEEEKEKATLQIIAPVRPMEWRKCAQTGWGVYIKITLIPNEWLTNLLSFHIYKLNNKKTRTDERWIHLFHSYYL